jgi:hypothetical protein
MKDFGDKYRYVRIIHFGSGDAYGLLALNGKLAVRLHFTFEFIGNHTKEELKKKYPNTSIIPHTSKNIAKVERDALSVMYRKEKIRKLLGYV